MASSSSSRRDVGSPPSSRRSEAPPPGSTSTASYIAYPISRTVSVLLRRLSADPQPGSSSTRKISGAAGGSNNNNNNNKKKRGTGMPFPAAAPARRESPFQPPPLSPLCLQGFKDGTGEEGRLLSRTLAEEIRLLVPPRLQLVEDWRLVYSLEQDGSSLSTLYKKVDEYRGKRGGFVLVVRDGGGNLFGAYLSDAPHPSSHFYGTGESFLWRSQTLSSMPSLASLPLPPSADTTNAQRSTTLVQPKRSMVGSGHSSLTPPISNGGSRSGTSTPERIRFKAFPYSGINDYIMFCEAAYLSVGGGDGHYGLWLDDNLENGVSEQSMTFGNEPLSDDGTKFEVLGVEMWYLGG